MNDNDKWLILDTPELQRLYDPIQEGDEMLTQITWQPAIHGYKMRESSWGTFRRLRSKAWLKASEHPIQFPAWVWHDGWQRVPYYESAFSGSDAPSDYCWQPAPRPPELPAKEDACEKAWRDWSAAHNDSVGCHIFKAGWEARGGK